jgi:hypothetical protein
MARVPVIIDDWKADIFKKELDANGYKYSEHGAPVPGVIMLRVETDNVYNLKAVMDAAERKTAN